MRRTPRDTQKATAINRRRSATSLMPMRIRCWATEGRKSKGSLNKSHVFRLNWIKIGRMESTVFKSALWPKQKIQRGNENIVITDSIQDTCQHTDYKSRTSWMVFSTSSREASASAIFCSYSSAVLGALSRMLWMALTSFTLANSAYFFCLMALGIWARVDLQ